MLKKIIFSLTAFLLFFFLLSDFGLAQDCDPPCAEGQECVEGKCVRRLEIEYPQIGGIQPKTVAVGLPNYISYVFQLAVVSVGFVIFGALVFNGVRYLLSSGNPAKLSDAKEGISVSFLGAVILLSAYLVFNTINPQLVILDLKPVSPFGQLLTPGVYLCNYQVPDIETTLASYVQPPGEIQKEAAKKLWKSMFSEGSGNSCDLISFSKNIREFTFDPSKYTMIAIPSLNYERDADGNITTKPTYEFGIILHGKENYRGKCQVYTRKAETGNIYDKASQKFDKFQRSKRDFEAKSVTLFKKPITEIPADAEGVVLYGCYLGWHASSICPDDIEPPGPSKNCKPDPDIRICAQRATVPRSVKIDPKGGYFGVVSDNSPEENCSVVSLSDPDVTQLPLIGCDKDRKPCSRVKRFFNYFGIGSYECIACISSVITIKGEIIGTQK